MEHERMTLSTASGKLTPVAPFDFAKSLEFLGHFRPAMGEQHIDKESLTKAASFNGQCVVFQVRSLGTLDAPELAYSLFSDAEISDALHEAARDQIAFFLSLNDDLRPLYERGQADPDFVPVIQRLYGYHQVKFPTPFENACWAILSQRNPMSAAHNMKERLAQHFGGSLTVEGQTFRAFPEPFQLALPPTDELNGVIRNIRKAECISDVARAFDTLDPMWLRTGPYDEVKAWLLSLKGIGAWSSAFILLRGLGRTEQIPPEEKWLLDAARKVYGRDTLTYIDLNRLANHYGEHQGYWGHYLRASVS
jgi:DNA-3-methyladenine glycosylase II